MFSLATDDQQTWKNRVDWAAQQRQPYKGLSGLRGNLHGPFLGEGVAAMRLSYPTSKDEGL